MAKFVHRNGSFLLQILYVLKLFTLQVVLATLLNLALHYNNYIYKHREGLADKRTDKRDRDS